MTRSYSVEPLSPDEVTIVYPLVAAVYPVAGVQQWQRYARALTAAPPERSGVLALRGEAGYFCGVLVYRNDQEPWHEPRLNVDLFVALDLIDARAATDALLGAAEAKAAALACTTVQIHATRGLEPLVEQIRRAGYAPAGQLMTKGVSKLNSAN